MARMGAPLLKLNPILFKTPGLELLQTVSGHFYFKTSGSGSLADDIPIRSSCYF